MHPFLCKYIRRLSRHITTLALCCAASACATLDGQDRYLVYYDNQAPVDNFERYDLLVFDGEVHPDLNKLSPFATKLGYLSVGELREGPVKEAMPEELIIKENETWKSYIVDIRKPVWYRYVVDEAVQAILDRGFDGVMLDTIDSALHLETQEPEKYEGMREAAIYLIKEIRHHYPDAKIMLNRGFGVLSDVAGDIDMLLAESILSHYDLKEKKATYFEDEVYLHYVDKIVSAKLLAPTLSVYTLDYWDMNDRKGVKTIYKTHRAKGFVPYVTTPDLRTIHHEGNANTFVPVNRKLDVKGRVNA